jgi:hypothetical protein
VSIERPRAEGAFAEWIVVDEPRELADTNAPAEAEFARDSELSDAPRPTAHSPRARDAQPQWRSRALEDIGRETDWYTEGESAAQRLAERLANPPRNPFEHLYPDPPPRKPKTVFNDSPDRVGKTITNADGETVLWGSPNCYISMGSTSIALRDVHAARNGVNICSIPLEKREARGDLFDEMRE